MSNQAQDDDNDGESNEEDDDSILQGNEDNEQQAVKIDDEILDVTTVKQSSDNETAPRASRKGRRKLDRSDSHNVEHSTSPPNKKRKSSTGRPFLVGKTICSLTRPLTQCKGCLEEMLDVIKGPKLRELIKEMNEHVDKLMEIKDLLVIWAKEHRK